MNCTAAPGLEALAPPELTISDAARLGILAHEVAADWLNDEICGEPINPRGPDKIIRLKNESAKHLEAAEEYATHIIEEYRDYDQAWIEEKLPIHGDDVWGTCDALLWRPSRLKLSDLKTGMVVVEAGTFQLKCYGIGAMKFCAAKGLEIPDEIEVEIYQPLAMDEPIRSVVYDTLDLIGFEMQIEAALKEAKAGGKFKVGAHCKWCRAKPECPAMKAAIVDLAKLRVYDNKPAEAMDPQSMSIDELDAAFGLLAVLEPWMKAVAGRAQDYLMMGGSLKSAKLVQKKKRRDWIDEAKMIAYADKHGIAHHEEGKLSSPAQMEKRLGAKKKADVADNIKSESPGVAITIAADKRDAIMNPEALANAKALLDAS